MARRKKDLFEYDSRPVRTRGCDSPGCAGTGDFRAPKNHELTEHYWFCLEHVRDYNRQWDYFKGMSPHEIEHHIRKANVWERPSWPLGNWRVREQNLREEVMSEFFNDGPDESPRSQPMPLAEREALVVLELTPPVTFAAIKTQYKALVKRHHPDANGGSLEAEERFKNINQAFTILKQLYESAAA